MEKLEIFLNKQKTGKVAQSDLEDFTKFGYDDETRFKHHLSWLLANVYPLEVVDTQLDFLAQRKKRMGQKEFRDLLFAQYLGKCVISGNNCSDELEAAHIIPYAEEESYDLSNGLVLTSTLHGTFDKYLWSINPKTLRVEVAPGKNVGQISQWAGKLVPLVMDDKLQNNLSAHYAKFKSK